MKTFRDYYVESVDKITVYRGVGQNTGRSVYGKGIYVTDNKKLAEKYGEVKSYKLDLTKILDVEKPLSKSIRDKLKGLSKEYDTYSHLDGKDYNTVATSLGMSIREERAGKPVFGPGAVDIGAEEINKVIRSLGYNGIRYPADMSSKLGSDEKFDGYAYVIFNKDILTES